MSLEVYINDSLIELENEKGIGLTFQVGSIFDLNNRSGFLTNKFKVPKTQKNNEIIGHLSNINSDSNIPYLENPSKIIQNGIELVSNGSAIIDGTSKTFGIAIYSGNVGFFDSIKGLNVNRLDWDGENHEFNEATILSSWEGNNDYIYPIIDWGKDVDFIGVTSSLSFETLVPCIRLKDIFTKTFAKLGITFSGSFKDSDSFNKLVVTPNNWGLTEADKKALEGFMGFIIPQPPDVLVVLNAGSGTQSFDVDYQWDKFSNSDFTLGGYTPSRNVTAELVFNSDVRIVIPSLELYTAVLEIFDNGVLIATKTLPPRLQTDSVGSLTTGVIQLRTTSVYTAKTTIIINQPSFGQGISLNRMDASLGVQNISGIELGDDVIVNSLFNYDVSKIIKDMIRLYDIIVQTNESTKEVSFNFRNDLQDNIVKDNDWSAKIDLTKPISVKYRAADFGQTNYLNYKSDEDVTEFFGRGQIEIQDGNLIKEKNLIVLNALSAESIIRMNNNVVPKIPIRTITTESFEGEDIRYLMLESDVTPFVINGSINVVNLPLCYFNKPDRKDSLGFDSLIEENYTTLKGMTNQMKFISASFNLKEIDVVGFDFTIPIFLDIQTEEYSINGYFAVDKISNFKDGVSTKVDLIRL